MVGHQASISHQVHLLNTCWSLWPPAGLKQYYQLVQSHSLAHKVFEEKVQHLLELFGKIPFNQALVFSNLHTRSVCCHQVATRWREHVLDPCT